MNSVFFLFPKKNNKWLNDKDIFVHPGAYYRTGDMIKVNVTNFGTQDRYLPKDMHLGNIAEALKHTANNVNTLDHRPTQHLSKDELHERRAYIIKHLRIDDNDVLKPQQKEEVIQILLNGWDAISIHEADYGLTNLMKFHIQIPKRSLSLK